VSGLSCPVEPTEVLESGAIRVEFGSIIGTPSIHVDDVAEMTIIVGESAYIFRVAPDRVSDQRGKSVLILIKTS
jgi:hypothetical protein